MSTEASESPLPAIMKTKYLCLEALLIIILAVPRVVNMDNQLFFSSDLKYFIYVKFSLIFEHLVATASARAMR